MNLQRAMMMLRRARRLALPTKVCYQNNQLNNSIQANASLHCVTGRSILSKVQKSVIEKYVISLFFK